jgi:hypothetical protein
MGFKKVCFLSIIAHCYAKFGVNNFQSKIAKITSWKVLGSCVVNSHKLNTKIRIFIMAYLERLSVYYEVYSHCSTFEWTIRIHFIIKLLSFLSQSLELVHTHSLGT